jgi:hypothetical protein
MTFFAVIWSAAIFCSPSLPDYYGQWNGSYIAVSNGSCLVMQDRDARGPGATAAGIFVTTHEEAHAHGIADEYQADCFAAGNIANMALALGYGPYWRDWFEQWVHDHRYTISMYGTIPQRCFP